MAGAFFIKKPRISARFCYLNHRVFVSQSKSSGEDHFFCPLGQRFEEATTRTRRNRLNLASYQTQGRASGIGDYNISDYRKCRQ